MSANKSPPASSGQNMDDPEMSFNSSKNYQELNVIGRGAYGTVYKARDLKNPDELVALKKVRVAVNEDGLPPSTVREISLLKELGAYQHPNVVRLLDVCLGKVCADGKMQVLYLVFEHVKQDLASFLEKDPLRGLQQNIIKSMSFEILSGVDFLHSHRIVHRDLKPQNLLVTADGHIKIADFGLAKTFGYETMLTTVVITLWYRPPEVLLGLPYHSGVDVWSCGAVLYEMHALRPLFPGQTENDQLERIFRIRGKPRSDAWRLTMLQANNFKDEEPQRLSSLCPRLTPLAEDLISSMLSLEPADRPGAQECLQHLYFTEEPL